MFLSNDVERNLSLLYNVFNIYLVAYVDIWHDILGLSVFLKNIAFHGILLDALFDNHNQKTKKEVSNLLNEGIEQGIVKPLNSRVFDNNETEQAFRYMASGRHIGKVIIKIRDEELQACIAPTPIKLPAVPRIFFNPKKTYIITGGLGGFGLEMCYWLIERGAVNIILTTRSGIQTGYQRLCLQQYKHKSANVVVSNLDVTDENQAVELINLANEYGPVGGIFNLIIIIMDAFMDKLTGENFATVCKSKIQSTINLDVLSRELCPELEWFVCFSSQSCGKGTAGQANYGYANSAMERICEKRHQEGLPGLAIQWGPIGDVGILFEAAGNDFVIRGSEQQKLRSCLHVLDELLQKNHPIVSSHVLFKQPALNSLKTEKSNILAKVANIFGLNDISSLNDETKLGDLGMDSLMAVEIHQCLERNLGLTISLQKLRELKFKDLNELAGEASNKPETTRSIYDDHEMYQRQRLQLHVDQQFLAVDTIISLNEIKEGTPLFMIHPLPGNVSMLVSTAKLLDCPSYGIQFTKDAPTSTFEDLASWYLTQIRNLNIQEPVSIAGYSLGAAIGFEMALQVEHNPKINPKINSVIFMEGAPSFLVTYFNQSKNHFLTLSEIEKEVHIFCIIATTALQINQQEFEKHLLGLSSFKERVNYVAENFSRSTSDVSVEKLINIITVHYNLIKMSSIYFPKTKLQRDLVLLKSKESIELTKSLSASYDLEKFCDGKITTYEVNGNHETFLEDKFAKETSTTLNFILKC